jgi:DNA-directed RNA polymerase specialized sigma24 family protein
VNAKTDTELVAQQRAGDPSAFEELTRRHVNWVYSAARRRTGDDHLAEDVTQAVFILVAQKPPKRWTLPSRSPWLFGVMIRTCKAALRARETRRRHETEPHEKRNHPRRATRLVARDRPSSGRAC